MLQYTAELPWGLTFEDIERLRGLGEVKFTLVIEGESRSSIIRELSDDNVGWHYLLGDPVWWQENLSRGKKVSND